ncbi:YceI family protein [Flagellimonas pelagia]|uniref:Polyisoprenoid-binding protein n=1 Tax=Flagellimonas pelagia TaxID=2306998 RepID=A0A3A1NC90_9FLAO|nr:YceI family protein [Allomuricauda maritima]RIV41946.1 polyisoprenoid-binding protein [Allomuricauda maritima]TXJ90823.1 YceI family protein [Allomuricauda maritima]
METTKWMIDSNHSEIGFKVKHMMFTNVSGHFREFEAEAETEDHFLQDGQFKFRGKVSSLNTGNPDRDAHLLGTDFFDAEKYPEFTYESTSYTKDGDGDFVLKGILTLKGISRPISLRAEFHGSAQDPWGNEKAGFGLVGSLNRKDWGLNWNTALETGGVLVGEEVKLIIELQFIRVQEESYTSVL